MPLSGVEAITFDCYGTLVDWETGIVEALRPLLRRHGIDPGDDRLLELFARHEAEVEAGPFRPYREVLDRVTRRIAEELAVELRGDQEATLVRSLPGWSPFPDTRRALARLRRRFRLGILSNVDDDLFAATAEVLDTEFEWVVTAEQLGSYKPAPANFEALVDRVGLPESRILHAAQSVFHDIVPARRVGLQTAWVRRRGHGATPPAEGRADLEVENLDGLADRLGV